MVLEGRIVWRPMSKLLNMISREVKRELYERVVMPTVVYGWETWAFNAQERRKIEVCLRNTCGIRRVDRVRNAIIKERCRCEWSLLERIKRNMLKYFGHGERMEERSRRRWVGEGVISSIWCLPFRLFARRLQR